MNIERIKELLQAQPFRPFRLRTADGKAIPVLHQEIVFLEPKADVVIVTKEKGGFYLMEASAVTQAETIKDPAELQSLINEARS
jgi:hypothetical protein